MKIGCRGEPKLPFAKKKKKLMSFGGLELQNELLEDVNLIIMNYQVRK
jgi:hypothetical protein